MKRPSELRVVFIATGDIALPAFRQLLERGPRPLAVVTQPDKPVGRHQTLLPPAIKLEALQAGIPVLQPAVIGEAAAALAALAPEVIVVMAYGQILRSDILTLATTAIINLHASLLPRHRGASCIQAAIDAGDRLTGITAMHMIGRLDAGDVIHAEAIAIDPEETGGTLHDRLAGLAPEVLRETLRQLADGSARRMVQDEALATYAPKLERDDGRIDWSQPAVAVARRIRAYDPWPGTFTWVNEGGTNKRMKIFPPVAVAEERLPPREVRAGEGKLWIGCGTGALVVHEVQPDGSRRMSVKDYLCGRSPQRVE
jgi:methionyl-tRNA formyltransferase